MLLCTSWVIDAYAVVDFNGNKFYISLVIGAVSVIYVIGHTLLSKTSVISTHNTAYDKYDLSDVIYINIYLFNLLSQVMYLPLGLFTSLVLVVAYVK